jgi:hypothetical protein
VVVGGFPITCKTTVSGKLSVDDKAIASKFDEFGNLKLAAEQAKLETAAIRLEAEPSFALMVIAYGGRNSPSGEAATSLDRIKRYFVRMQSIEPDRIMILNGGYREEAAIELWVLPPGAQRPAASPTVDPAEIKPTTKQIPGN